MLGIEPAEGFVAIKFLEGEGEDATKLEKSGMDQVDNVGLFAVVIGTGRKVTNCKAGDTVVVQQYARNGLRIGDDTVLVEAYCVVGRITGK